MDTKQEFEKLKQKLNREYAEARELEEKTIRAFLRFDALIAKRPPLAESVRGDVQTLEMLGKSLGMGLPEIYNGVETFNLHDMSSPGLIAAWIEQIRNQQK
jgi:hypothetical protein